MFFSRWRQVVSCRSLWRCLDPRKLLCLPRSPLIPTTYMVAISYTWSHHDDCMAKFKFNAANLASDSDPSKQVEELDNIYNLVQNNCLITPATFVIDTHRHLITGPVQVQVKTGQLNIVNNINLLNIEPLVRPDILRHLCRQFGLR